MPLISKNHKAFTLIELLAALTIITFISVAFLAYVNPAKQLAKARDSRRRSDIGIINTALKQFYMQENSYPDNLTSLLTGGASGDPVIGALPKDPSTNDPYFYVHQAGDDYALCACMETLNGDQLNGVNGAFPGTFCASGYLYCQTKEFY